MFRVLKEQTKISLINLVINKEGLDCDSRYYYITEIVKG